ncbi:type II secretion system minor pseudopilin GspI [Gayadomonas joobiniege]|uniref:type II secretion system minor pseudopilin GspI n=1 Tax=Gayadomonas joobiniege TaxID=1234606 RepID=UPI00037D90FA|nr:type II secretion system minor pseudopilin GspI [Gayadomonas joobiniege]
MNNKLSTNVNACQTPKKSAGFTILEVIVALGILATAGVAVVQSSSVHINNQARLQEHAMASWVASNQLNQLLMAQNWPIKKGQKGESEIGGRNWYWQLDVLKTAFGDELVAVKVLVYSDAERQDYVTEMTTYLSKP